MPDSRTVTYSFEAKQSLTQAFTQTQQSVAGAAGAMGEFSTRINETARASDTLKVSVRETGNEWTRLKDQANAAAAQQKTSFEQQRNDLRLLAEQARTTAAQTRAAQAEAAGNKGGGGLLSGLPQISLGNFIGNQASQAFKSGITNAAESSLTLAGNLEQSQVAFTGLLGSASKATDMIGQLRTLDLQAGIFNFQDLQKYSTALLGVGDSAQRIIPDLKDLGSEIAGRGQGPQQLEQATLAYEQVIAKGHLAGQEALQFQNAQIPIWQILSDALGKSVGEIQKMSEAGQITSQIVQDAFHLDAVTRFGTALADQTHTFNGLKDTALDMGQIFLATFGEGVIKEMEPRIQGAMDALQNPAVLASIKAWGVEAGKFVGQLLDAAKVVASWAGLQLPDIPAAPDFAPAAEDTKALQTNLQASVANTVDFTRQITAAKNEVTKLRDGQADSSAHAQQAANDIRDAQTGVDRSYDRQLNSLKDAGTQMERNYQVAKQQRDLEQARQSLSDDTRLAGDIFSSAGQAARERLKDDQKRVTDQQAEMAQATAKFENQQAQTRVERSKQASDQQAQDQITGIQRAQQASEQATAARIRDLEATERGYQALQDALTHPDAAIKAASDEYRQFYDSTIPQQAADGAQAATTAQVAPYQSFFQGQLPQLAKQGQPALFAAIFGSGEQQQQAGVDLAGNIVTGIGTGIREWSKGHGSPVMNLLMGGTDFKDAFQNWAGGAAGIENLGGDFARSLFPDWKGIGPLLNVGQGTQDTTKPPPGKSFADGHYVNGIWTPFNPTSAPVPQTGAPDFGPGAGSSPVLAVKVVNGSYNGTYGGGRAEGGPVEAGGWYKVGESGPEWLHAGGAGRVTPQAPGGGNVYITVNGAIGNPTQLADYLSQVLAQNMRLKGAR